MSALLPDEIEVEDQWPESYRFRLPRRDLGSLRWVGVVLLIFALIGSASVAAAIAAVVFGVDQLFHRHVFGVAMFIGLPSCAGVLPLWWGLALLCGRSEITVTRDHLRTRERIGPFSWGKRWSIRELASLSVTSIFNVEEPREIPPWLHRFDSLKFGAGTTSGTLTWGYPASLLEPLALALGEVCDRAVPAQPDASYQHIGVYSDYRGTLRARFGAMQPHENEDEDEDDIDEEFADEAATAREQVAIRPAFCAIEVEEFDGGLTIKVPPAGLWRGTRGLFPFSLVWTGATAMFTALVVAAAVNDPADFEGGWIALLVLGVFWLVGIAIMLSSINMARREAAIAVAGDSLMVIQRGPFGTKRKEWLLTDVEEVRAGPSGLKVNDVDVLELQIHTTDPHKFGILAGRPDQEIYWLADLLSKSIFAEPTPVENRTTETA